ncbi:MAG TPA: thermonuclease family protein [Blastocatellia bacterium]|nr:thermonuclease family protein [Blastocatellia bacterium]
MTGKTTTKAIFILFALLIIGCNATPSEKLVMLAPSSPTPTAAAQQPQTITGKVVAIADGDTLTVLDANKQQHTIRLVGIDAPEIIQAFGDKAKNSLSDLVRGKTVTVTNSKVARNGWIVGKVTLNGRDINLEQINRGMAWFYRAYAKELSQGDATVYEQAEARAREKRRGLWSEPGPLAPWDLRAAQRGQSAETELEAASSQIVGDRDSKIYHRSDCPDYSKVSERNRAMFATEAEAVAAGYKKAKNCP